MAHVLAFSWYSWARGPRAGGLGGRAPVCHAAAGLGVLSGFLDFGPRDLLAPEDTFASMSRGQTRSLTLSRAER